MASTESVRRSRALSACRSSRVEIELDLQGGSRGRGGGLRHTQKGHRDVGIGAVRGGPPCSLANTPFRLPIPPTPPKGYYPPVLVKSIEHRLGLEHLRRSRAEEGEGAARLRWVEEDVDEWGWLGPG
jgi:hypothetical protein